MRALKTQCLKATNKINCLCLVIVENICPLSRVSQFCMNFAYSYVRTVLVALLLPVFGDSLHEYSSFSKEVVWANTDVSVTIFHYNMRALKNGHGK